MLRTRFTRRSNTPLASQRTHRARNSLRGNLLDRLEERITPITTSWLPTAAGAYQWTSAANWSNGVPSNPGDVAIITPSLAGAQTIQLGASESIGTLDLGDANGAYPISIQQWEANTSSGPALATLTFSNPAGASIVDTSSAGDSINVPLTLTSNLTVTNSGALTLGTTISGAGALNMAGAGNLLLNGPSNAALTGYTGGTTISAGTITAPSSASLGTGTITQAGGVLALTDDQPIKGPIALSGFTSDVIIDPSEGVPGTSGFTNGINGAGQPGFDGGGYVFFGASADPSLPTFGLPASRSFTSAYNSATVFQFAPYTANNGLILGEGDGIFPLSGTLYPDSPNSYSSLAILNGGGNGGVTFSFTLNFAGGSSTTVTGQSSPDWFSGGNVAISNVGRTNTNAMPTTTSSTPELYEDDYTLSAANALKTLVLITFTVPSSSGATNTLGIMAISGVSNSAAVTTNVPLTNTLAIPSGTQTTTIASVTAGATATAGLGALSFGSTATWNATATSTTSAYSMNIPGVTSLAGTDTINLPAAGSNSGSLTLGPLYDSNTAATLNLNVSGSVNLTSAAKGLISSSQVDVAASALNIQNSTALGSCN